MARIDWSRHRSLAVLADLFTASPSPEPATFDPAAAWDHRYAVVLIVPDPGGATANAHKLGWLRLQRRPEGDGVTFEIDEGVQHAGGVLKTTATLRCAADELSTPRSWTVDTSLWANAPTLHAVADGTVPTITGEVKDGELWQRVGDRAKPRRWPAPQRFTAHWCLFDVVQRLAGKPPAPFDLFEAMDQHKPGHRLSIHAATTVQWSGKPVALRGYDLLGHGFLPYTWWLDDSGRVVIAAGAQRAYLWDPSAGVKEAGQ